MNNKPAIAARSVREALGPYARLETVKPPCKAKRAIALAWTVLGSVLLGIVGGIAFGLVVDYSATLRLLGL